MVLQKKKNMEQVIQHSFTTLEQSKILKEKGIEIPAMEFYSVDDEENNDGNQYRVYHQWEFVEWLRFKHQIWINVDVIGENMNEYRFVCFRSYKEKMSEYGKIIRNDNHNGRYETPQEAYSAAFDYILKNIL